MALVLETPAPAAAAAPPPRRRRGRLHHREWMAGYLFIAPAVVGFAIFVGGPLVEAFRLSTLDFNSLSGVSTFVGFENYARLASDGTFSRVLLNTAVFSLAVVPANIILGLTLAVLVNQRLRGIWIFRAAYFTPVVISLVAWSLVWDFLLQADGGVNAVLSQLGIAGPNWLADENWAMTAVVVVQILKGVGVSMVLFLAALQEVPEEVLEAARIDGASRWRTFYHVTLPLISPAMLLVSTLATISALKSFAQIFLLTQGGPGLSTNVLGYFIYDQAFNAFRVGYASTAAVVLFVIVMSLTLLQWWGRRKWVHSEV